MYKGLTKDSQPERERIVKTLYTVEGVKLVSKPQTDKESIKVKETKDEQDSGKIQTKRESKKEREEGRERKERE